ncbi:hypothetical protein KJ605_00530 [Patescibacteria group bacterium]|nr:hypothetical protein [Patescibacteria group bacterium]
MKGIMKNRWLWLAGTSAVVGLLGAGISLLLPNQYTATGLLVVTRKADEPSPAFFTYEGNYAQQNSGTYTGTFLAILQSPGNLKSADANLDIKRVSRLIRAKREGSQAIALNVKGHSPEQAARLWHQVVNAAMKTHAQLAANADALITVTITSGSPVVLKTYPNWKTVLGSAFLFSAVIIWSLVLIARYLKEDHDY